MTHAEFTATRDDMATFQSFVTAGIRRSVRSPLYWGVLILLAVIVGGLLTGAFGVQLHRPTAALVLLLVALFWSIISRLYRHAASPYDDGSLVGPRRVELNEAGIRQVAPLHEAFTAWGGVRSVHESSTHIFLMTDRLAGYIVPRRAFTAPDAAAAFAGYARERLASPRPSQHA